MAKLPSEDGRKSFIANKAGRGIRIGGRTYTVTHWMFRRYSGYAVPRSGPTQFTDQENMLFSSEPRTCLNRLVIADEVVLYCTDPKKIKKG